MELTVIAGPNGAGKSTVAARLIPPGVPFVNADDIARDIPMPASPQRDVLAGRMFLERLEDLVRQRARFALETTLSGRTLATRISAWREAGYRFSLVYVWLESADLSILRVAERVRRGGHNIPDDVIRRRYNASLRNLINKYVPMADEWIVLDNSRRGDLVPVAAGGLGRSTFVYNDDVWRRIEGALDNGQDSV